MPIVNGCLSADRVFGKIMGELQSPKPPGSAIPGEQQSQ